MNLPTEYMLVAGAILFAFGTLGFLTRRNLILMFLSLELMLAGVSTNFLAFGKYHGNFSGQIFSIFILTVAACEAALALALVVALHRRRQTLDIRVWQDLGEDEVGYLPDQPAHSIYDFTDPHFPKLTPAGRDPLTQPAPISSSVKPTIRFVQAELTDADASRAQEASTHA